MNVWKTKEERLVSLTGFLGFHIRSLLWQDGLCRPLIFCLKCCAAHSSVSVLTGAPSASKARPEFCVKRRDLTWEILPQNQEQGCSVSQTSQLKRLNNLSCRSYVCLVDKAVRTTGNLGPEFNYRVFKRSRSRMVCAWWFWVIHYNRILDILLIPYHKTICFFAVVMFKSLVIGPQQC